MPLIDTPFKRVAVDLVGPIFPATDRKNRYILTLVDYATRYPEAIPLPSIEAERVAEALVDMFSRLGIPEEILTDRGSQFTSEVMHEVSRLLSLRQLTTTPKIDEISMQFSLQLLIKDKTHFTEHSSSLIDLMLVNKPESVIYSGVSDPFLPNLVRYHCPIFAIFKFAKPKIAKYKRTIWNYEMGDFDKLRSILAEVDWSNLNNDISINDKCEYVTSQIKTAARCQFRIKPHGYGLLTIRG